MKRKSFILTIAVLTTLLMGCGNIGSNSDKGGAEEQVRKESPEEIMTEPEEAQTTDDTETSNKDADDGDTALSDANSLSAGAPASAKDEILDANLVTKSQVEEFLQSPGVNGLLWEQFSDLSTDTVGIYNIIYQLSDDSTDWDKVYDEVEAAYGEVYTDVTYMSTASLDDFLLQVLGVTTKHPCISLDADYIQNLDVYFVMHGDTNYTAFSLDSMYVEDNRVYATLTDIEQFDNRDILVVMELHSNNQLRILSVEKIGPQPAGLGYGNEFVFENSQYEIINASDLEYLTDWELKVARNEIFARHGRKFKNEDLQYYFDCCSWYTGLYSPDEFDASCLNDIELKNIEIIDNFQNN